jgi:FKBP-type peptidyl-prolyl cis-trans isomerase FkpA
MKLISIIPKFIALSVMVMVSSCSGSQTHEKSGIQSEDISLETYINVNRSLVEREQQKIEKYVKKNNLDMQQTGTGLWYKIDEPGAGDSIRKGQVVTLDYQVKLLDGTICYDSEELGQKKFLVGQGGVESGLEEGVLLLRNGASARFIMPPHLAHGLIGDDNQIPSRAIILYVVKIVDVKKQ